MNEHNEHHVNRDEPPKATSFWRSRAGTYLIFALVIGGLLLGYEHRFHILAGGGMIWLLLLACVGMHFFMHGGHGGHGRGGDN
ncbi:MAG: DUF2933 domain-containing protein [Gammaproteobacteria bacterium]|nr:DUF2933 domain-containing protein [Gammaproteobacteria bacterium]